LGIAAALHPAGPHVVHAGAEADAHPDWGVHRHEAAYNHLPISNRPLALVMTTEAFAKDREKQRTNNVLGDEGLIRSI